MSTPPMPNWLAQLIAEEGESKPMDVSERESLLGALNAAKAPEALDLERHRRILEQVLAAEDPYAPPCHEEIVEAKRLREHLDSDPLVVSLRSAQLTSSPNPEFERKLRKQVLSPQARSNRPLIVRRVPIHFGVLAIAAGVAIWISAKSNVAIETFERENPKQPLALSRSTESLFTKPFESSSPSERIDKIALVRARDLRNNRYAKWGLP